MILTIFESLHTAAGQAVAIEWDALCTYLAAPPEYPSKHACPLLKLATFGDVPSPKGILRHDANVTSVWGVEGDHDDETVTPLQAAQMLQRAGVQAIIYTSPSHTPGKPRWRVLAPTSQAYAPALRRELAGRVNAALGGCLRPESFTLSQAFYFGRVAGVTYEAYATTGQPVDLCGHLVPLVPSVEPRPDAGDLPDGPVPEWRGPTDDADLLRRALQSRSAASTFGNRASFADLWEGNAEALAKAFPDTANPYNASEADAALAAHLSFWTGRDAGRIERLMRQSGLARPKWDREDYLPRTIGRITSAPGQVLQDNPPEPPAATPPATAEAPRQRPVEGATILTPQQQVDMFKGCVYVQAHHKVLAPGGKLLKPEQFRVAFGGFVHLMDNANQRTSRDSWEAFTQSEALRPPVADSICFRPDLPGGEIIDVAGKTRVNTWWPAKVRRQIGDSTPFHDLMRRLLPVQRDRELLLSYMAACVQHQGHKFSWWPVLQGCEGNGKTTMSLCVAETVGQHYTHWPHALDLASPFNGWIANKVFIAVEELYSPEHQADINEKLKTLITGGAGIQVQFKGVDQESMGIVANGMITTNHKAAVRKTRDNQRRLGLFYTAQQTAADMARDGLTQAYFRQLYRWLKGDGFAIVAEVLHEHPIPDDMNPAADLVRAPDTSSTEAAILESMGPVEQQIVEAIEQGAQGFAGGWVSSIMLDAFVCDTLRMGNKLSITKRREMLHGLGYIIHPGLEGGRTSNPVQPDGKKPQLWVRQGSGLEMLRGPAEIARAYTAAQMVTTSRAV